MKMKKLKLTSDDYEKILEDHILYGPVISIDTGKGILTGLFEEEDKYKQ